MHILIFFVGRKVWARLISLFVLSCLAYPSSLFSLSSVFRPGLLVCLRVCCCTVLDCEISMSRPRPRKECRPNRQVDKKETGGGTMRSSEIRKRGKKLPGHPLRIPRRNGFRPRGKRKVNSGRRKGGKVATMQETEFARATHSCLRQNTARRDEILEHLESTSSALGSKEPLSRR